MPPKTTYSIRVHKELKAQYLLACAILDVAHADLTAEMMKGAITIANDPDHPIHQEGTHDQSGHADQISEG